MARCLQCGCDFAFPFATGSRRPPTWTYLFCSSKCLLEQDLRAKHDHATALKKQFHFSIIAGEGIS